MHYLRVPGNAGDGEAAVKIKAVVTVDINPDAWMLEYGIERIEDVRADVIKYIADGVIAHMDQMGMSA